jgi:hypothetical protein
MTTAPVKASAPPLSGEKPFTVRSIFFNVMVPGGPLKVRVNSPFSMVRRRTGGIFRMKDRSVSVSFLSPRRMRIFASLRRTFSTSPRKADPGLEETLTRELVKMKFFPRMSAMVSPLRSAFRGQNEKDSTAIS